MTQLKLIPGKVFDFDNTRLYSPSELLIIEQHNNNIFQSARLQEQQEKELKQKLEYESSRPLSSDEYYQYCLKREEEKKKKEKEEELLRAAQEQARLDFMESTPPLVEIVESVPVIFLSQLQAWIKKGYMIDLNNVQYFAPGCFAVNLTPSTTN